MIRIRAPRRRPVVFEPLPPGTYIDEFNEAYNYAFDRILSDLALPASAFAGQSYIGTPKSESNQLFEAWDRAEPGSRDQTVRAVVSQDENGRVTIDVQVVRPAPYIELNLVP